MVVNVGVAVAPNPEPEVLTEALECNQVLVADLEPYPNNPRHNDAAVPRMVETLKEFGFRQPILIDGTQIVDGHLRIKAAKQIGLEYVPAIDVGDMPEAKVRALRIVMNKSAEWADWDNAALADEFKFIMDAEYDLAITGFTEAMIQKVMHPDLPKTQDADAGSDANPEYVQISFHVTAAEREQIKTVLEIVKVQHGLANRSRALAKLIKDHA